MQIKIVAILSAILMAATPAAADCVTDCWNEYFQCVGNNIPEPTCAVGRRIRGVSGDLLNMLSTGGKEIYNNRKAGRT
ncbi:hypothetical protein OQA88_10968 [Cercophora sp. LCS_1]